MFEINKTNENKAIVDAIREYAKEKGNVTLFEISEDRLLKILELGAKALNEENYGDTSQDELNEKKPDDTSLYYIQNIGWGDTTVGIAEIPDAVLPLFKSIITNLNKNSTYDRMPTIEVYKINKDMIRELSQDDFGHVWEHQDCWLYQGDKIYVLKESLFDYREGKLKKGVTQII